MPRKGRARRFREARELKQGYDDGLFSESGRSLADADLDEDLDDEDDDDVSRVDAWDDEDDPLDDDPLRDDDADRRVS